MQNFFENDIDVRTMSPLALAFLGDGVYGMFVREYLISKGNSKVNTLHKSSVEMVRCEFQALAVKEKLQEMFTEEEEAAYLRGRNAKVGHIPKNAQRSDYHAATGFESLFGYLYLKGDILRLKEFFDTITEMWEKKSLNHQKGKVTVHKA